MSRSTSGKKDDKKNKSKNKNANTGRVWDDSMEKVSETIMNKYD